MLYDIIQPNDSVKDQGSYLTYAWCVVDADSRQAVRRSIQTEAEQTVIVQEKSQP
jgi:hypothetical protein